MGRPARALRSLLLVGAGVAITLLAAADGEPLRRAEAVASSGSVSVANSREGAAIFSADRLAPGQAARGSVTIRNTGTRPGRLSLSSDAVADTPGPGGGQLSRRLRVDVAERLGGTTFVLYGGAPGGLGDRSVGVLEPGGQRTFEFSALLPDAAPSVDNPYAGSTASVQYRWQLVDASADDPADCRLRVRVPSRQRLLRRREMIARVRVSPACRATVYGHARRGRGRARYLRGARNRVLAAGRTHRVRLRLTPGVRKTLRGRRRKVVVVQVRAGSELVTKRARVR